MLWLINKLFMELNAVCIEYLNYMITLLVFTFFGVFFCIYIFIYISFFTAGRPGLKKNIIDLFKYSQ